MTHRHSFNESIYSEPYGGRYFAMNTNSNNRMELNRPIPLSESASASNIYSRIGGSGSTATATITSADAVPVAAHSTYPQYFFPQNYLSQRDMYGTTSSVALNNGLASEVSSTRSSVYSDKTIFNETTPPSTPRSPLLPLSANEQTIIETNPNKTNASNASGSQYQSNLQSIYNTNKHSTTTTATATATATTIWAEKPHPSDATNVENSATIQFNTDDKQSKI